MDTSFSFGEYFVRSPREYLLMFRERWFYGILPAAIVAFLMVYLEFVKPEVYETQSSLHFETKEKNPLPDMEVGNTRLSEVELNNHLEWIQSQNFFDFFTSLLTDKQIDRIQAAYRDPETGIAPSVSSIIRSNFKVRIRGGTTIVMIIVRHRDPEVAADIANLLAARYIAFNINKGQTDTNQAIIFLNNELQKLQDDLEQAKNDLSEFREQHNLATLGDEKNLTKTRVTNLNSEIIQAELDRFSLQAQMNDVNEYKNENKDLLSLSVIKNYGNVKQLMSELESLEKEKSILDQRYFERHPWVIKNLETQASTKEFLKREIQDAEKQLKTDLDLAVEREKQLKNKLNDAESKLLELDRVAVKYEFLQQEADTIDRNYRRVQERLSEANISSRLDNTNITIFDKAWKPFNYIEPNIKKAVTQACFLAFFVIAAIPLVFGVFDIKLKSPWDVEHSIGTDLLGEIPKITEVKKKECFHVVAKGGQGPSIEAFRGIYSQILVTSPVAFPKIILTTSTIPNEGKTLVSNNLAATFAAHGKKTLLMDCDYRRPSLDAFYDMKGTKGSIDWIESEQESFESLKECIFELTDHFSILRAGSHHKRPTVLFEQERFELLMRLLREHYDLIILDTPPVGIFPDATVLSRYADELIFLCRFNKISKMHLRCTMARLFKLDCHVLGTILNGIPSGTASKYYGYYGYGSHTEKTYSKYYKSQKHRLPSDKQA